MIKFNIAIQMKYYLFSIVNLYVIDIYTTEIEINFLR